MLDTAQAETVSPLDPQPRDLFEKELLSRTKVPVLRDGTPLSDLVDIRNREVSLRTYNDPELHRLELDKIWAKIWVPVCHETELPNAGDFKRGYIGEDNVVVTRAGDGSINVLLNACSHRGMEICRSDEGNTRHFKCPYHGWVFDLQGKLLGAPFEKEQYGAWDKSKYPLTKAKVECRNGVYFATFNPDPPPLDAFMTEFAGFFDLMFATHDVVAIDGSEFSFSVDDVIPPGLISANWKAIAVQNVGDGYHAVTLHHSLVELGMMRGGDAKGFTIDDSYDVGSTGGHCARVVEVDVSAYGVTSEVSPFPIGRHIVGSMFPSCNFGLSARMVESKSGKPILVWMAGLWARAPKGSAGAVDSGLGLTVMNREAFEAIRSGELDLTTKGGRPFDFAAASAADDPETWVSQTRAASGSAARRQTLKYNALGGAAETPNFPEKLGIVAPGIARDDNMWWFWLAYYDWMTR